MAKVTHSKHWLAVLAVILIVPAFAGCFGGDDKPKAATDGNGVIVNPTGGASPTTGVPQTTDHSGDKKDPAAHFHHYWGIPPAESVLIYNGAVPIQNLNNRYLFEHNTLAWSAFDLETDKDDVWDPLDDPTQGGKADAVFAGTNRIVIDFPDNLPNGVGAFVFFYKPSNSPKFLPENGVLIENGAPNYEIALDQVGMSDPPHQFTASRWKFFMYATNSQCEEFQLGDTCPPAFIQDPDSAGESTYQWGTTADTALQIVAYNGGVNSLDPPHPNFWTAGDTIPLDTTEGSVPDPTCQTPIVRERISGLTGIAMQPNNIVPLGTEYVDVTVSWTNSAPTNALDAQADFYLGLKFHGADGLEYMDPPPLPDGGDNPVIESPTVHKYRIYDLGWNPILNEWVPGVMVDPPYESNSFWRFQLVPTTVVNDVAYPNTGCFQGTWELTFSATRDPEFVLE